MNKIRYIKSNAFTAGSSLGNPAASFFLNDEELKPEQMQDIDLSYADEDECYFADETMWLKNDPVSIAKQTVFDDLQVFLDDGKEDKGQFYRACEKLFQLLRQNGADVQNHVFEGHHSGDYIRFNMETYLRFYSPRKFQLNKIAARWPARAMAQFYFIEK